MSDDDNQEWKHVPRNDQAKMCLTVNQIVRTERLRSDVRDTYVDRVHFVCTDEFNEKVMLTLALESPNQARITEQNPKFRKVPRT